ncbi:MAG: Arginine decarboxylase [Eubacteriales bacterium SKADARSKE-1]|nr:Arginine decarboxylase [Eubacteriales bacterium SKADARSKE-1]
MNNTPLYDALKMHRSLDYSSFHTPGHKGINIIPPDLLALDYTELPDTDSLFDAAGPILKAEQNAAEVFGAKKTLFSAGGCTLCIQTMLRLALPFGGKIICSRMIHKNAINAMALLDIEPVWVVPKKNIKTGFLDPIDPQEIKESLKDNIDTKAVYITSPDYYGVISDIKELSNVCREYNIPLLVDNAHGAHLGFVNENLHPLKLGAAMTADSAHKTLPVLTGGAFLHIADEKYIPLAKSSMALFGSTSPSYPIMASLDMCCGWLKINGKKEFSDLLKKVEKIKKLAEQKGILTPSGTVDPTRISLNTKSIGLTGNDCAKYFRSLGIEPEFSDDDFIVLITTPFNTDEDFLKLYNAILKLPINQPLKQAPFCFDLPNVKVSLKKALFSSFEKVNTKDAINKICAETLCVCPPGIPILIPGEIINEKAIKLLLGYGIFTLNVLK